MNGAVVRELARACERIGEGGRRPRIAGVEHAVGISGSTRFDVVETADLPCHLRTPRSRSNHARLDAPHDNFRPE